MTLPNGQVGCCLDRAGLGVPEVRDQNVSTKRIIFCCYIPFSLPLAFLLAWAITARYVHGTNLIIRAVLIRKSRTTCRTEATRSSKWIKAYFRPCDCSQSPRYPQFGQPYGGRDSVLIQTSLVAKHRLQCHTQS